MLHLTEYEKGVLAAAPGTEFGRIFFNVLQAEIDEAREADENYAKVSDDPINEDWRYKRGEIAGMKRALNLPGKYINNQQ